MTDFQFEYFPYQRPFQRPLQTHHGVWTVREGIIVRLTDANDNIGLGEIAPIPWFGSETLEQALEFCQQLPEKISEADIWAIPEQLPACQFGFESGLTQILAESPLTNQPLKTLSTHSDNNTVTDSHLPSQFCGLLPSGKTALEIWETLWKQGYQTLKWKIAVNPIQEELAILQALILALPNSAKLRLDANGGLTLETAKQWLNTCEAYPNLEFIEQPLAKHQFGEMLALSQSYSTAIALDESVAQLTDLETCHRNGWRSIFVIKPSIIGSPRRLRNFCQQHTLDLVFSSSFETEVGRFSTLRLAQDLANPCRALGFGITHIMS